MGLYAGVDQLIVTFLDTAFVVPHIENLYTYLGKSLGKRTQIYNKKRLYKVREGLEVKV